MTSGITNWVIDQAYKAAIEAGSERGKLLGAGGGGFLIFFAPPEKHEAIRSALQPMRETLFTFAPQGSSIIFVH